MGMESPRRQGRTGSRRIDGVTVRTGDRVRLRPKEGGDILDIALRGQIAIVESIEEDYEGAQQSAWFSKTTPAATSE